MIEIWHLVHEGGGWLARDMYCYFRSFKKDIHFRCLVLCKCYRNLLAL